MESGDSSGWFQWALTGLGTTVAVCVGWLMTYQRRMTMAEAKVEAQGKAIAVLYEKDSQTNEKLDLKLDRIEAEFKQGLISVQDDIKDLIREVAKKT